MTARKSLALVCIAVLLMTALVLPAAWVDATLGTGARLFEPALGKAAFPELLEATPRRLETVTLHLFRGPPAALETRSIHGSSTREVNWHGRAGGRGCSST